ncbi:hypothetical protein [Mycobacterium colombiense]
MVRGLAALGWNIGETLVFLFDFSDPADKLWAEQRRPIEETSAAAGWSAGRHIHAEIAAAARSSTPRVITDRGLGVFEQDSEWSDCDGDRWRYNHAEAQWENTINRPDFATGWYPAVPHERNAPYTEIVESSSAADVAPSDTGGLAAEGSSGPEIRAHSSEERPAPPADPLDGAALGPLSRDDLMDAANAAGRMASIAPSFEKHWRGLEQRLEDAAIAASK